MLIILIVKGVIEIAQEKIFEDNIKRFLTEHDCWYVKYWGGGSFTKAGIPDILCCCKGKFIGIEVKAQNGKPSALQLHHLRKIDDSGGFGILLYPNEFQLFKNFILCLESNDMNNATINYNILKRRWSDGT